MEDKLEKAFQKSLENYQEPYNPKAWESLQARMAGTTGAKTGVSNSLKWILTSASIAIVAIATYYFWPNNSTIKNNLNTQNTTIRNNNAKSNKTVKHEGIKYQAKQSTNLKDNVQPKLVDKSDAPSAESKGINNTLNGKVQSDNAQSNRSDVVAIDNSPNVSLNSNGNLKSDNSDKNNEVSNIQPQTNKKSSFVAGQISNTTICIGQAVTISNPTAGSLVRFEADGSKIVLKTGDKYTVKPKATESFVFTDDEGKTIATKIVQVHAIPTANFSVEANIFDKGLPVVNCKVYEDNLSCTWEADKQIRKSGEETSFNFFTKGMHSITLNVIDQNGCANTITKKVNILDKYNLLAVDAFKPGSVDSRTNSFMPYALKERNVRFHLSIVDPSDNHIVFESENADNTWDGTDASTGKMTPANKTYIWKVRIENPQPNERPIYVGTVVHS